jgi:hypothetical protein
MSIMSEWVCICGVNDDEATSYTLKRGLECKTCRRRVSSMHVIVSLRVRGLLVKSCLPRLPTLKVGREESKEGRVEAILGRLVRY